MNRLPIFQLIRKGVAAGAYVNIQEQEPFLI